MFVYIDIFVAGIIVADWYIKQKNFLAGKKNILFDVFGLASIYCIITFSGFQNTGYRLFLFACYFLMFISIFKGVLLNKILTNKWITIAGGMVVADSAAPAIETPPPAPATKDHGVANVG